MKNDNDVPLSPQNQRLLGQPTFLSFRYKYRTMGAPGLKDDKCSSSKQSLWVSRIDRFYESTYHHASGVRWKVIQVAWIYKLVLPLVTIRGIGQPSNSKGNNLFKEKFLSISNCMFIQSWRTVRFRIISSEQKKGRLQMHEGGALEIWNYPANKMTVWLCLAIKRDLWGNFIAWQALENVFKPTFEMQFIIHLIYCGQTCSQNIT